MITTNDLEKDILLSLKGRHWNKMIEGIKRYEVRKKIPNIDLPFKALIYATKSSKKEDLCYWHEPIVIGDFDIIEISCNISNGLIVGEIIVDEIVPVDCSREVPQSMLDQMCITMEELMKYSGGGTVYAWHISSVNGYNSPRSISSVLRRVKQDSEDCVGECIKCHWHYISIYYYEDDGCTLPLSSSYDYTFLPIFTAPQSWCYCYDTKEIKE